MFRHPNLWKKTGDFSLKLPPEIQANCHFFVKYSKGDHQLCLLKRLDPHYGTEYQIIYTTLNARQINEAMHLPVYDLIAAKKVKAAINSYRTDGFGTTADGIETCFLNKMEHLQAALNFIDAINPLNEIRNEVFAYLGIALPDLQSGKNRDDIQAASAQPAPPAPGK